MKKRIVVMLLSFFFSIGGFTAAGQFDLSGMSADLTDLVVSAKTQTSSSTVSVDDILQEANRIKNEQHLPIATSQDDDENSWTLAIYMCGSDLERDKAAGTRDLCEMLGAQHKMEGDNRDLDNLNLIVMTGGAGDDLWRPESVETPDVDGFVKPQGTQIWQISGGQMYQLYKFNEYQDMSDGILAKTFFRFAAEYAPAEHMMIEYWDHGGGPIKGAEFALNSDGSDNRYMPLNELSEAVSDVKEYRSENGKNLEIIGFDCCLMSSLEVAYAFRDNYGEYADYMIASEETEPIDGWDYYWLEIFAEMKEINTPSGEQSEIIGKRIVDLYPGDKIVDKKDHSQLDDVERAKGIWEGRDPDFTNGTLALIDLRCIDTLMQAMGELGTALNNIYVNKDTKEDEYVKLSKAITEVKYMSDGRLGQADIYVLADKLLEKNINDDLNTAATNLKAAVGNGSLPEPKEVEYTVKEKTGEARTEKGMGGQIGKPGDDSGEDGAVLYRGVTYMYAGCAGMAVFCPANLEVESVYLDAVTARNRTIEEYKGIYNDRYNQLAFAEDPNVKGYVAYVRAMANLQDETRDFGVRPGYLSADIDDASNTIFMKINGGDASKLTKIYAEMSVLDFDEAYYLGSRTAAYNKTKKRYEVPNQHNWLSIDGVSVTFEDHGFGDCILPVVIEKGNQKGQSSAAKYKEGDVVSKKDVCHLYINPEDGGMGRAKIFKWFDPYLNQHNEVKSDSVKNGLKIRPLRQKLVWDNEKNVYVKGDFIACKEAKIVIEGEATEEWDFTEAYLDNTEMKQASDQSMYLMMYNFKAYDMNTKAYVSNPVYALEMDWSKLKIDPIKTQTCTGKAVKPVPTFSVLGQKGITLKDLRAVSKGIDIKVAYANNVKAGTARVTVTGTEKSTNKKLYSVTRTFKLVQKANPLKVKNKTVKVKRSKLKKGSLYIKASRIKKGNKAKTKITYKLIKAKKVTKTKKLKKLKKKAFTVKSSGKIKVRKGTKKGTYKLTIRATAAKSIVYKKAKKNFVVTVKVK